MKRGFALLIVLTLVAPAVAAALCDVTCATTHLHAAHRAAETTCHGQHSGDAEVRIKGVANPFCHDTGDRPSATLTAGSVQKAAPLAVLVEAPEPARQPLVVVLTSTSVAWHPPDLLPVTTPLRI